MPGKSPETSNSSNKSDCIVLNSLFSDQGVHRADPRISKPHDRIKKLRFKHVVLDLLTQRSPVHTSELVPRGMLGCGIRF